MTDHPSLSEQRAHLIAREMEAFEAAYPCCDLTKYKAGEVIAGRARYAEPEVDKMFSAWLAARTPNPQSENLMVHAQEWLDHLRSDGPHALHTAAANLERVIQQIAFAQPPASGVDREALIEQCDKDAGAMRAMGIHWIAETLDACAKAILKAASPIHPATIPGGERGADWLSKDDAETTLWQAIEAIKIGNKTDDKLILENLRAAGIWLARFEGAKK